ncbi:hypothetical protein GLOIN_2v1654114 [Rhizophagus irregularis DAOM 181602=DAOM 197198]|uniref:Uncharacterized protein n=1 Tax=Rhizophagus irregularis (strain DAOM 181602 / DAOM 197198 / MUCL 43194) TaxID=747089 RepID=A0A2P4PMY5_RHIID|nr:hypothetical protein GLOIN_2v1654114 [Rhizophagus irregularis DAOM 181602=DAOM 197198]POG66740.1 hypothetical protein GLOIN_2v1654114 [Rhizophagus irregularis DAOM 181602=DAOM 197198]|eukprot:XP_025173606.1 hypothetical protein GLOIN_2v1654114 [Rhizophagus irregularis DAOM 181602=DAOM 197198]
MTTLTMQTPIKFNFSFISTLFVQNFLKVNISNLMKSFNMFQEFRKSVKTRSTFTKKFVVNSLCCFKVLFCVLRFFCHLLFLVNKRNFFQSFGK